MSRNMSLIAKRFLVRSFFARTNEMVLQTKLSTDRSRSWYISTHQHRDSSNSVNYPLPLFFSLVPAPLFLSFSISRCLSFNTLAHIRCRTCKGLTMAGKFTVVMKLSGGLSYIGALPQARQPIACGHYLSACRLHRLRYLYD